MTSENKLYQAIRASSKSGIGIYQILSFSFILVGELANFMFQLPFAIYQIKPKY